MTDAERWDNICRPTLDRIEKKVDRLVECVETGNGKPSLMARVASIEKDAATNLLAPPEPFDGVGSRRRSLKIGPIELNGYQMSDIIKAVIAVALCACIWLMVTDRSERAAVLKEIRSARTVEPK